MTPHGKAVQIMKQGHCQTWRKCLALGKEYMENWCECYMEIIEKLKRGPVTVEACSLKQPCET